MDIHIHGTRQKQFKHIRNVCRRSRRFSQNCLTGSHMTTIDTQDQLHSEFEKLLEESAIAHGHCCPGQVLGVKMALLGLKEVGISDPKNHQRKDIIIYVEM